MKYFYFGKSYITFCLVIYLLALAFSPFLLKYVALLLLPCVNLQSRTGIITINVIAMASLVGIVIDNVSGLTFEDYSLDFINYYNNYLDFLHGGFSIEYYVYGSGIELLFPTLNYILSIIIEEELPHIVKLCYAMVNVIIYLVLLNYITIKLKLRIVEILYLFVFSLVFFKLMSNLQLLRQGLSSYFVVFAIFSSTMRSRNFFIATAVLFHLSAVAVYPLIKLFIHGNQRAKKIAMIVFSFTGLLLASLYFFVDFEKLLTVLSTNPLLSKLIYTMQKGYEEEIFNSFMVNLKFIVHLIPLIVFYYLGNRVSKDFLLSVFLICIFFLSMCVLPSFAYRLSLPIFNLLLGYFYFLGTANLNSVWKAMLGLLLVCYFFVSSLWYPGYYYNFNMFSSTPFYYLPEFSEQKGYTDRSQVPRGFNIENEFR